MKPGTHTGSVEPFPAGRLLIESDDRLSIETCQDEAALVTEELPGADGSSDWARAYSVVGLCIRRHFGLARRAARGG